MQGFRQSIRDVCSSRDIFRFDGSPHVEPALDRSTKAEDQDDIISFESLDWEAEPPAEESDPKDSKPSFDFDVEETTRKTIAIFDEFAYQDPVLALTEEYRKLGVDTIEEYFEYQAAAVTTAAGKKRILRRCVFRCPLSHDLRKVTSSCAPLPLLLTEKECKKPMDALIQHTINFLGTHFILDDGYVYYDSRMGAKKSAALKRLLEIHNEHKYQTTLLFESTMEASLFLQRHHFLRLPTLNSIPTVAKVTKKEELLPEWVHKMSAAGVVGSSLSIEYREFLDEKKHGMAPTYWTGQPTQLCCIMKVSVPHKIQVVGEPMPSKKEARDSAVDILVTKLQQRRDIEVKAKCGKKNTKKKPIAKGINFVDTNSMRNKKSIYASNKQQTTYFFPLPNWARQPFPTASSLQQGTDQKLYLYELSFADSSGKAFVAERLNLPESVLTQIAIIFPADIEPNTATPKQEFWHQISAGKSGRCTLRLRYRSVMNINDLRQNPAWQLEVAMKFTAIFTSWPIEKFFRRGVALPNISPSTGNAQHRTYLFVPLLFSMSKSEKPGVHTWASIDWKLIEEVVYNKSTPYIEPSTQPRIISRIDNMGCGVNPWSCLGFLVVLTGHFLSENISGEHGSLQNFLEAMQRCHTRFYGVINNQPFYFCWLVMLITLLKSKGHVFARKPRVQLPELRNRVLLATNPNILYLFKGVSSLTPMSPLYSAMPRIDESTQKLLSRYCLKLDQVSLADFIFRKTGESIKYPRERLLEAFVINMKTIFRKHPSHQTEGKSKFLIPEHVTSMPVPIDIIFLASINKMFLPMIERMISLEWFCHSFRQMMLSQRPAMVPPKYTSLLTTRLRNQTKRSFSQLLDDATSLSPVSYQRLEFLGDTVLGYFMALNAMSKNSSLCWDYEDVHRLCSHAAKNVTLVEGALKGSLNRLLYVQGENSTWLSAYGDGKDSQTFGCRREKRQNFSLSSRMGHSSVVLADFKLSDVVESVIGAVYLGRHTEAGGSCAPELLEMLNLPFVEGGSESKANQQTTESKSLPITRSQCLSSGFPFHLDRLWQSTLSDLAFRMSEQQRMNLHGKVEKFWQTIESTGLSIKHKIAEHENILLMAALYDNTGFEVADDDSVLQPPEKRYHDRLALLRDTLFCVGSNAFAMIVTEEIFNRYPKATAGDLQLLQRCVIGVEVLGYVLFVNGLSACLLEGNTRVGSNYKNKIKQADSMGRELWSKREGWLVLGGKQEYKRRYKSYSPSQEQFLQSGPRYPGLVAGHVIQKKNKSQLKPNFFDALTFSFKSLVGSLVLTLGVEGMWAILGCYFEELLLLSPEELRQFGHLSPLVQDCKKGRAQGGAKRLNYGVLD